MLIGIFHAVDSTVLTNECFRANNFTISQNECQSRFRHAYEQLAFMQLQLLPFYTLPLCSTLFLSFSLSSRAQIHSHFDYLRLNNWWSERFQHLTQFVHKISSYGAIYVRIFELPQQQHKKNIQHKHHQIKYLTSWNVHTNIPFRFQWSNNLQSVTFRLHWQS